MIGVKPYISLKTAFFAALLSAVVFIFLFFYLGINQRKYTYEDTKLLAKEISRKTASETQVYLISALMTARSIEQRALIYKKLSGTRKDINEMLVSSLGNPLFMGAWSMWEPNAYDNRDYLYKNDTLYDAKGTMAIAFFKYNNKIFSERNDLNDFNKDFYTLPKTLKKELIIDPFYYQYHNYSPVFYQTSAVVPILLDSTFLGVVGIDIDLNELQQKINKIRPYKTGFLTLITNHGVIISHKDSTLINKCFFDFIEPNDTITKKSIQEGKELTIETFSKFSGKKVFRFFYPINVGHGTKPWSMMVEIPIENATTRSKQLIYIALGILIVGLLLIAFLSLNIFDRRRYDRAILAALKEVEERNRIATENARNYQEVFNSTNEAIFIHDAESGKIIDVNNVMLQMYGYKNKSDVLNLLISDLSANSNYITEFVATQHIKEALSQGSRVFEWQAKKKNGEPFWAEVSLRSALIGGQKRLLAVVRDITERKKAAKELLESQQLFQTLAQMSPVGIFRTLPNGFTTYVNPKWTELSGLSFDEALGDGWLQAVHPEDRKNVKRGWSIDLNSEKKPIAEYRFLRPDGTIIWVLGNVLPEMIDGELKGYIGTITNITDIKQAQEELAYSEKKFRDMSDLLPQTVWETDINGAITYVNKNGILLFGYAPDEIYNGLNILSIIIPEERERAYQNLHRRFRGEPSKGEEYTALKKDGSTFPAQIFTSAIIENNKPIGIRGISIDITEIKNAEKILKESEEKYRTLMESMNEVVIMADNNHVVQFVNKRFTEKLGYTPEEIIGTVGYKMLHDPKDYAIIENANVDRVNNKISNYEVAFIAKNGDKIDFLVSGAPVENADGEVVGSIGAMIDISERKIAENALKESEERYRTIIEAFPDIIMISDLDGNIIFGNEAMEKITGIKPEDYNNPNRKAHVHPEDKEIVKSAIVDLLKSNKTHTNIIENRYVDSWGETHWLSGIISKLQLKNKIFLQTITRDISEKKVIEKELEKYRNHLETLVKERTEELEAANEELSATNEELNLQREKLEIALNNLQNAQKQLILSEKMASLGVLAAGVAHEINNPLNFILGGIMGLENYIKESLPEHIADTTPLINAIHEGVRRSTEIVSSLNSYSRKNELPRTTCNIHSIIDSCLVMIHSQTKDKIEIVKEYCTDNFTVECREGQMHQAFLNILVNAVHAMDGEGTIKIITKTESQYLKIYFIDNGCGISKENLPKITDPFFTTKDPGKGTGLGLSITYNIIAEHHGTIEFKSKVGQGTTVIVSLPINNLEYE